jgi:hypothetical protein
MSTSLFRYPAFVALGQTDAAHKFLKPKARTAHPARGSEKPIVSRKPFVPPPAELTEFPRNLAK